MTYQEVLWKGKTIQMISLLSRRGKVHQHLAKYCGMRGRVLNEAKNGMLLVEFECSWVGFKDLIRSVPAGCVQTLY